MPNSKLKCPNCPRTFKGGQGLAAHLRHSHPPTIPQRAAKIESNGAVQGLDAAADVLKRRIAHAESDLLVLRAHLNNVVSARDALA